MGIFNKKTKFKNSELIFNNGFYLPSGLGITNHRNRLCLQNYE